MGKYPVWFVEHQLRILPWKMDATEIVEHMAYVSQTKYVSVAIIIKELTVKYHHLIQVGFHL